MNDAHRKNSDSDDISEELDNFYWMPGECRVSLFAQELKATMPVLEARLFKTVEKIRKD